MKIFTDKELKLFTTVAKCSQYQLKASLEQFLKQHYKNLIFRKEAILAIGDIPIMLVAHMDTVFPNPPTDIFYDSAQSVCWSPDGLGADDRAGVYAILEIIRRGYKPHILFTTDEELGGVGVSKFVKKMKKLPRGMNLNFILQLDRHGKKDSVYYNCGNKEFQEFINSFGFVTANGSFSDISILCPTWDVAGVNLSIGYELEHTELEFLYVSDMYKTIDKVCLILDSDKNIKFDYKRDFSYKFIRGKAKAPKDLGLCHGCMQAFQTVDLIPVRQGDYCVDCYALMFSMCEVCGKSFEKNSQSLCSECRGGFNDK